MSRHIKMTTRTLAAIAIGLAGTGTALAQPASEPTRDELRELVKERRRALAERTAAVFAELRGLFPVVDPLTAEEVMAAIAPGEVLLSYVWSGDEVSLLVARDGTVEGFALASGDDGKALRERAGGLHAALADPLAGVDPGEVAALSGVLLPESVGEAVRSSSRTIIVGDGPLLGLPFEVLSEGTFVYAPSATVYVDRLNAGRQSLSAGAGRALVLGDPVFGQEWDRETLLASSQRGFDEVAAGATALDQVRLYGGSLAPLPGTGLEARAVSEVFKGTGELPSMLVGKNATAPRLRRAIQTTPRYLHLATHGLMGNVDRPFEASLALTQPDVPEPDDIGFLTLQEILSEWLGRLQGTELVVLSACDTGRGVSQGDTFMSLPLGFFAAGAETVVASLWQVDDAATALLMARFYENLLGAGAEARTVHGRSYSPGQALPKLDALNEAKSWLRSLDQASAEAAVRGLGGQQHPSRGVVTRESAAAQSSKRPYEHPYFWSAFVLMGSPE